MHVDNKGKMKEPLHFICPNCHKDVASLNYFTIPDVHHEIAMSQCPECDKYYEIDICHNIGEEVKL